MRTFAHRFILLLVLGATVAAQPLPAQENPQPAPAAQPTTAEAASLLRTMSNGLLSHDSRLFLSAFDLHRMPAAESFSGQAGSLFQRAEGMQPHLHLLSVEAAENNTARVQVEAQLELRFTDGSAERREKTLMLTLARGGNGWRVVELEPRTFFY